MLHSSFFAPYHLEQNEKITVPTEDAISAEIQIIYSSVIVDELMNFIN